MILAKYAPQESDTWFWTLATLADRLDILALVQKHFQCEIDSVFTPDPALFLKNLGIGLINQEHNTLSEQIVVARNSESQKLLAWAWIVRGVHVTYAPEELADARFAHVDLELSQRTRITLLAQILQQWELWARCGMIPIISSSTVRSDQRAFLRLHEQAGYQVRGSITYKRIL
jgi:hypothetical protein